MTPVKTTFKQASFGYNYNGMTVQKSSEPPRCDACGELQSETKLCLMRDLHTPVVTDSNNMLAACCNHRVSDMFLDYASWSDEERWCIKQQENLSRFTYNKMNNIKMDPRQKNTEGSRKECSATCGESYSGLHPSLRSGWTRR